ncbi:MAG: OmpP1/FadL family transporter [Pseudolabrys sp.]
MSNRRAKSLLLACGSACALLAATAAANAGGFAIREMSSWGQGSSYAGVAAGGDLSAMFWNPATMTQAPGIQTEISASGIFPYAANTVGAGSTLAVFGGTGNTADNAFVPSGYVSWQFNPDMWFGLSVNAPFGLSVSFPDLWAGRDTAAGDSHLRTYNATPSFAYRINDWISVGVGVQIQYADASLTQGLAATPGFQSNLSGTGWGYGFTGGVTLTPTPTTTLGIGYRSAINQKISGTLSTTAPAATSQAVNTTVNLPDIVSVGLRQRISPQWTLLGTVEWSNWSRIGTSTVYAGGAPALLLGAFPVALPFQFKDGWFLSAGAEYQWSPQWTLRAGLAYEKSPITDDVRIPLLPDNDRYWASVGATYKVSNKLSLDAAYSHIFVKNTSINVVPGNPWFNPLTGIAYVGSVSSHIDIISVALKYRWDDPAPEPVKQGYFKAK